VGRPRAEEEQPSRSMWQRCGASSGEDVTRLLLIGSWPVELMSWNWSCTLTLRMTSKRPRVVDEGELLLERPARIDRESQMSRSSQKRSGILCSNRPLVVTETMGRLRLAAMTSSRAGADEGAAHRNQLEKGRASTRPRWRSPTKASAPRTRAARTVTASSTARSAVCSGR